MLRGTLLLTVALAGLLAGGAGARTEVATLQGTVGPGFSIALTRNGQRVTRVSPGVYRIVVRDRSPQHNFVLERSGGGVERSITSVPFVGTKTVTMRLTAGKWEVYCAPHASSMHADLRVGA